MNFYSDTEFALLFHGHIEFIAQITQRYDTFYVPVFAIRSLPVR